MKIDSMKTRQLKTRLLAATGGLTIGLLSLAVNAASFPDYPLQTGAGLVPPNIMFILDNSGSMAFDYMTVYGQSPTTPVDISSRAKQKNSLAYDPEVTYEPWDTVDALGNRTVVAGGTSYLAAYDNTDTATSPVSIGGNGRSVFYLLRDTNAPDSATSYDRYRINSSGTVVKAPISSTRQDLAPTAVPATLAGSWRRFDVNIPADAGPITISLRGLAGAAGDADLYVTTDGTFPTGSNNACSSTGTSFSESCTVEVTGATALVVRVQAYTDIANVSVDVNSGVLGSEGAAVPTSTRANAAELTNIATWYSFHRTRLKAAKAGASRAFITLGAGYRVGLDTLYTQQGNVRTSLLYPIPVDTLSGRFEGQNRIDWYTRLQDRVSVGGTPLRSALKRTGDYYATATPWGDGANTAEQKCRASYAMLTTDGYWNSDDGFSIGSTLDGNASDDKDGDGLANTLADVAYYYYANDLRPNLDNNVPTTPTDNNPKQHMSMFGVSIGLRGTTPLSDTPPTTWPDPLDAEDSDRIDDLWHAAVNSRGPKMIVATQSTEYANAVRGALNQIKDQRASGSNITSNGNSLNNGAQLFQAMFTSPVWGGDVMAYDLTRGGIASTPDWSLASVANANGTQFTSRPIITTFNNSPATFDASHVPSSFVGRTGAAAVTRDDNLAYVKGERKYEMKNAGLLASNTEKAKAILRDRMSPIGDIVNSSPFYQRQINSMFIAANDGMLHGVDAESGRVIMSYVPQGIDFAALSTLSDPNYVHRFFVDGQVDVSDTQQGATKNVLAASLGRGGKGVFALDVTSINTRNATTGAFTGTFTASNVLFDNTGSGDADMGYVAQQPLVRLANNNLPVVITGNGFESVNGKAFLYIYGLDGSLIRKIATDAATGNGLSQVSVADTNNDDVIDVAYAGDMLGRVWKFDLSDARPTQWDVAIKSGNGANAASVPLFSATDSASTAQPITGGIVVTREPGTGTIFLSFGTGKFITTSDVVSSAVQQTQTIYGLKDLGVQINGRTDLQARTFPYSGTDSLGRTARGLEAYSALGTDKKGWYLDLASNSNTRDRGERVVTSPALDGTAVWVSSIIPLLGSSCEASGRGYVNVINIFTGTNPATGGFFDVNGNGAADDQIVGANGTAGNVSSVDLGVAMPGAPAIVDNKVAVLGSNSRVVSVDALGGAVKTQRLMWREIVNLQ